MWTRPVPQEAETRLAAGASTDPLNDVNADVISATAAFTDDDATGSKGCSGRFGGESHLGRGMTIRAQQR